MRNENLQSSFKIEFLLNSNETEVKEVKLKGKGEGNCDSKI